MKKRLLAGLLAGLMTGATLLSLSACGSDEPEETGDTAITTQAPAQTEDETIDWSAWQPTPGADLSELSVLGTLSGSGSENNQAAMATFAYTPDNGAFTLKEADADGSTVTLRANTVSALRFGQAFNDGTVAQYKAKVQINTDPADANWCSLFIGLRLSDVAADPTTQSGVWIALQSDKIGLRTNAWAETTLLPIAADGVSFSTARTLYIEDNMETDVVTLAADNDSGERVELCTVKVEDGKINLYRPGETKPAISDKLSGSLNDSGRVSFWLHHTKNPASVTDLSVTGMTTAKFTAATANQMAGRDILSDTWVGIDDEGRVAGTDNGVVNDRKVGIFYFLWHDGSSSQPIYDHSAAYAAGGKDKLIETMTSGPLGFAHYWAEPYFGYYRSDDEWVIRKHTYQLTAAGVDFIFIDATNGLTYEHNYETILKVWSEMRAEGHTTPQIMFHCGNTVNLAEASFNALWANLYSTGRYEDLWFKYEGKPLILMPHQLYEKLTPTQQAFFNYRQSWAFTKDNWYTSTRGNGAWAWADMFPQRPGKSHEGAVEQMIVMCGFWANGSGGTNAGRSYSYKNGGQPNPETADDFSFSLVDKTSGKGIAFEEQFDRAIGVDPGVIMITGWNEWWAGRWEASHAIGQTIANTYKVTDDNQWTRHYFVDCFNPEYSRDIEPVKGYFNDNYYYQMVQNIREYKGSRVPLTAFGQRPIDMSGDLSQWDIVGPEYRDYTGDVTHRNHGSYVGQLTYTNDTGRNDFVTAKVSRYGDDVCFFAECASDITAAEGTNWMNLYINADADLTTGWHGYEYLLNRTRDGKSCSIQKFVDGEWKFEDAGKAAYTVSGKVMQIKVSAAVLGLGETFDFKWADNSVDDGQIMHFLDLGDTAPDGRFNYRYTAVETKAEMPAVMNDLTVLKAGSYYAAVDGALVRLDETTTRATFLGDEEHLYVPAAFARDTLGLDVSAETTYNHYGVSYVDISAALEKSGKSYARTENMLVIGEKSLTDDDLLTIYRAIY